MPVVIRLGKTGRSDSDELILGLFPNKLGRVELASRTPRKDYPQGLPARVLQTFNTFARVEKVPV